MADDTGALCEAFQNNIDDITLDWVARVKQDAHMRSDDRLTTTQIVDHVPQMLEELCSLLGQKGVPDFEAVRAASQHGYTRSLEGYSLVDLLRELELLRDCVFNFVAETETEHNVNRRETFRVLKTVNQYFGEDIIFVVEHFLKNRQGTSGKQQS
ncbi:MAG: hypothetical protein QOG71_867 [Pyrinomonadaceae bacterium]|nr:hypothetical protein [Pyrinomonadaceae bacterium]